MKRMCNMQMHGCCCQMMMVTMMKGSVYIVFSNQQTKHKQYEKISFNYSSSNSSGVDKRLGRG
jgi:hypothetical protein